LSRPGRPDGEVGAGGADGREWTPAPDGVDRVPPFRRRDGGRVVQYGNVIDAWDGGRNRTKRVPACDSGRRHGARPRAGAHGGGRPTDGIRPGRTPPARPAVDHAE